ncbi:MAG: YcxB family protein [Gammaproteobacteria bacterium]
MTNEPVTLEFDNKLADHLAAQRLYYRQSVGWKADKVAGVLLVGFGIVLLSTVGARWWTLIWLPLGIAEWFNLLSLHGVRTRLAFKSNPKFREPYQLDISEKGIHFKTTSIDSQVAWTHYSGVLEDERVVLLIYGRWMYTVIPKSAFRDGPQFSAFIELVNQHLRGATGRGDR